MGRHRLIEVRKRVIFTLWRHTWNTLNWKYKTATKIYIIHCSVMHCSGTRWKVIRHGHLRTWTRHYFRRTKSRIGMKEVYLARSLEIVSLSHGQRHLCALWLKRLWTLTALSSSPLSLKSLASQWSQSQDLNRVSTWLMSYWRHKMKFLTQRLAILSRKNGTDAWTTSNGSR